MCRVRHTANRPDRPARVVVGVPRLIWGWIHTMGRRCWRVAVADSLAIRRVELTDRVASVAVVEDVIRAVVVVDIPAVIR